MFKLNILSSAVLGIVLLLLSVSCTESIEQAASPKYDVTFKNPANVLISTGDGTQGLESFSWPEDVYSVNFAIYDDEHNWITGNSWSRLSNIEIPDSIVVPALDAGAYHVKFTTFSGGNNARKSYRYLYPLYVWQADIDLTTNTVYNVEMTNIGAKVSLEVKDGIGLSEEYSYFSVKYQTEEFGVYYLDGQENYLYNSTSTIIHNLNWYRNTSNSPTVYHLPNRIRPVSISLYGKDYTLIKLIDLDMEYTDLVVNQHLAYIIDVDALCNACDTCDLGNFFVPVITEADWDVIETNLN